SCVRSRLADNSCERSPVMRRNIFGLLSLGSLIFALSTAGAQPPGRPGRGGPDRDGPSHPPPSPLFEALDKDHDGELSAEEIQSASESLKRLDKNGDGKLTGDEIHPQGGPGRPGGRGPGGPDGRGPEGRGPDGAGPGDR